jgi:hypothetical protein
MATYPTYNTINTNPSFYGVKLLEANGTTDLMIENGEIT